MMSRLIRANSETGGVLFCAVDSTDIVREAERISVESTAQKSTPPFSEMARINLDIIHSPLRPVSPP